MRKKGKKPTDEPVAKTVGVYMLPSDLAIVGAYQADQSRETMVTPKAGPSVLALFRAGAKALGYQVPT